MELKAIDMLSEPLKQKLLIEANKVALKESPIFKNNFSNQVIMRLLNIIREVRYTPEEVICKANEQDDSSIFFIQSGKIQQYIEGNRKHCIRILQKGDCFGLEEFFTGECRKKNYSSIDFCTLIMIKRDDFLKVLLEFPFDYEKYCNIKDNIIFLKNYKLINLKCNICQKNTHLINECPLIHFAPNEQKLIAKNNFSLPTLDRDKQFIRKKRQRSDFKKEIVTICEDSYKFVDINQDYLEKCDWIQSIQQEIDRIDELNSIYDDNSQSDDETFDSTDDDAQNLSNLQKSPDSQFSSQSDLNVNIHLPSNNNYEQDKSQEKVNQAMIENDEIIKIDQIQKEELNTCKKPLIPEPEIKQDTNEKGKETNNNKQSTSNTMHKQKSGKRYSEYFNTAFSKNELLKQKSGITQHDKQKKQRISIQSQQKRNSRKSSSQPQLQYGGLSENLFNNLYSQLTQINKVQIEDETIKEYQVYFPQNNITIVLYQVNKIQNRIRQYTISPFKTKRQSRFKQIQVKKKEQQKQLLDLEMQKEKFELL